MNYTLFYIGLALFVIGFCIRLYYGLRTREVRTADPNWIRDTEAGRRYRRTIVIWAVVSSVGILMAIFAI